MKLMASNTFQKSLDVGSELCVMFTNLCVLLLCKVFWGNWACNCILTGGVMSTDILTKYLELHATVVSVHCDIWHSYIINHFLMAQLQLHLSSQI